MQKLGGLLLIVSGLSLGTYTFLPPPHDGEQTLREITRISAAPDRVKLHDQGRRAWIEPGATASSPVPAPVPATRPASAQTPAAAAIAQPDAEVRSFGTWTAIVTASTDHKPMTSSQPGDEATRAQLTRDLQQSLHRVGCYAGEINGAWTPSTKRAMSSFLDRVNAALPMHEPDYILLTLVQSHRGPVCGEACPAGQSAGSNGRCLPDGVLAARAAKSSKRLALKEDPSAGRRALASAPRGSQFAPAQTASLDTDAMAAAPVRSGTPVRHEGDIVGTPAGNEQLPWLAEDNLVAPVQQPRPIRRPDGMMAVGAGQIARAAELGELPSVTVTGEPRRAKPARKRAAVVLYDDDFGTPASAVEPAPRPKPGKISSKKKAIAARKAPPPGFAAKPKQKFIYFAGGRRGGPRPGSPAYNMMQAMGGIY